MAWIDIIYHGIPLKPRRTRLEKIESCKTIANALRQIDKHAFDITINAISAVKI